jgi:hypothetical protein
VKSTRQKEDIRFWAGFWARLVPLCALALLSLLVLSESVFHPGDLHWWSLLSGSLGLGGLFLAWKLNGKLDDWSERETAKISLPDEEVK